MKASTLTVANLAVATILLLTPLLVGVTASAPYDPWNDLDDNGAINIFDVVKIAGTYGTTGNPGKNVTLVGRANKLAYNVSTTVPAESDFATPWISVDGYSKVSVCIYSSAWVNRYQLETRHEGGFVFFVETQTDFLYDIVKTYDVPNEEIRILFTNSEDTSRQVWIDIYLIP